MLLAGALLAGCLHGGVRHDYIVAVAGALVDGVKQEPIAGTRVTVKVGDEVIYDGVTDEAGALDFTYRYSTGPKRQGDGAPQPITVYFHVDAGDFGVVEIPVTLSGKTGQVTLGKIQLGPAGG